MPLVQVPRRFSLELVEVVWQPKVLEEPGLIKVGHLVLEEPHHHEDVVRPPVSRLLGRRRGLDDLGRQLGVAQRLEVTVELRVGRRNRGQLGQELAPLLGVRPLREQGVTLGAQVWIWVTKCALQNIKGGI